MARDVARRWNINELADDMETAVSELVTNAVIHGQAAHGSLVVVTYTLHDEAVRVEVRDFATGEPRLLPRSPADLSEAENGRGLALVAALSDRWGVTSRVVGKSVWFELRTVAARGERSGEEA